MNKKDLIIKSDSSVVVSRINSSFKVWKYKFILNEIFSLLEFPKAVVFNHQTREVNCMADWLAKNGVERLVPFIAWT